jgi:hypothetical protein
LSTASAAVPSMYARLLRVRHLRLSGLTSFLLFEGAMALAVLLALAELVSWWGVLALPLAVAVMVKFNDVVAEALSVRRRPMPLRSTAPTRVVAAPAAARAPALSLVVPAARHEAVPGQQPVRIGGRPASTGYPYPTRIGGQRGSGQTRYLATGINERWLRWSA